MVTKFSVSLSAYFVKWEFLFDTRRKGVWTVDSTDARDVYDRKVLGEKKTARKKRQKVALLLPLLLSL